LKDGNLLLLLSVYHPYVCLSVCQSVRLSVRLSIRPSVCLSVCVLLSVIVDWCYMFFFLNQQEILKILRGIFRETDLPPTGLSRFHRNYLIGIYKWIKFSSSNSNSINLYSSYLEPLIVQKKSEKLYPHVTSNCSADLELYLLYEHFGTHIDLFWLNTFINSHFAYFGGSSGVTPYTFLEILFCSKIINF